MEFLQYSDSEIGAQNVFYDNKGAYTGEISCSMLKNIGCQWVIIGHSERRTIFGETDQIVRNKLDQLISEEMNPIVCIGETKNERDSGKTQEILSQQLSIAFENQEDVKLNTTII